MTLVADKLALLLKSFLLWECWPTSFYYNQNILYSKRSVSCSLYNTADLGSLLILFHAVDM